MPAPRGHARIARPRSGMYILYYWPGRASLAVHWMLIELGVPFEARPVDFATRAHKDPEYLSAQSRRDGSDACGGRQAACRMRRACAHAGRAPSGRRSGNSERHARAARLPAVDALFRRHAATALSCLVLYRRSRSSACRNWRTTASTANRRSRPGRGAECGGCARRDLCLRQPDGRWAPTASSGPMPSPPA